MCRSWGHSVRLPPRSGRPSPHSAGPYWTHVLFTWKSKEGLKVYVNGTLSTADPSGKVSHAYGEPEASIVLGPEQGQAGRYENRAFDEFIIWERALTPDEVAMYFTAAVGQCGARAEAGACSRGHPSLQPPPCTAPPTPLGRRPAPRV